MIVRVGERQKTIVFIQRSFMDASYSPLPRPFEAAGGALAARDRNRHIYEGLRAIKHDSALTRREHGFGAPALERVETWHASQTDAATHNFGTEVLLFNT